MGKIKSKRIGIAIDMTPLVDVAFLLLIFFMTTTQFKPPEIAAVTLPKSRSEIHVPESKVIIVTITDDRDRAALALRIQSAIASHTDLAGVLIRVVKPSPPQVP